MEQKYKLLTHLIGNQYQIVPSTSVELAVHQDMQYTASAMTSDMFIRRFFLTIQSLCYI